MTDEQINRKLAEWKRRMSEKQRDVKGIAEEIIIRGNCNLAAWRYDNPDSAVKLEKLIANALQTERDRAERIGLWLVRTANSDGQWSEWTMTDIEVAPHDYRQVQPMTPAQVCLFTNSHRIAGDELRARAEKAEADLAEAVEALRPFAKAVGNEIRMTHENTHQVFYNFIETGYFRRAASLVAKHTTDPQQRKGADPTCKQCLGRGYVYDHTIQVNCSCTKPT